MACSCKNKQNGVQAQPQTPIKPNNPQNNGSVGGRRIEKRIIR